jgi:hypothetical protein
MQEIFCARRIYGKSRQEELLRGTREEPERHPREWAVHNWEDVVKAISTKNYRCVTNTLGLRMGKEMQMIYMTNDMLRKIARATSSKPLERNEEEIHKLRCG